MTQPTQWSPSDIVPAESDETDKEKRRGRIPQSAWPGILERYKAGATLSALAREFNCTPSAISYIVRKAEAVTGSETDDAGRRPEENTQMSNQSDADASVPAPESTPANPPQPQARADAARPPEARSGDARHAEPRPEPRTPEGRGEGRGPDQRPPRPPQEGRAPNFTDPRRAAQQGGGQPAVRLQLPTGAPAAQQSTTFTPPPQGESPYRHQPRNPVREESVEAPAQPADQRMAEAATAASEAYRKWKAGPGEAGMQTLADALHDLRKVIARMEIEISASRREEHAARPIPIPMHRAAQRS